MMMNKRRNFLFFGILLKNFRDLIKWFVMPGNPWFARGHDIRGGTGTGVFALIHSPGSLVVGDSFRVLYYD